VCWRAIKIEQRLSKLRLMKDGPTGMFFWLTLLSIHCLCVSVNQSGEIRQFGDSISRRLGSRYADEEALKYLHSVRFMLNTWWVLLHCCIHITLFNTYTTYCKWVVSFFTLKFFYINHYTVGKSLCWLLAVTYVIIMIHSVVLTVFCIH